VKLMTSICIPPLHLVSASGTHGGCARSHNEDRLLDRPDLGLWAVADGMGGHSNGDVAAQIVTDALAAVPPGGSGYALLSDADAAIAHANFEIRKRSQNSGHVSGSTIVALLIRENHFACLWAGDSRAYLFRAGKLTQLTHDHSLVQQLVDDGLLTETERSHHPRANVITRAVGHTDEMQIARRFGPVLPGDRFLLCSDGLTACTDDAEICDMIRANRNATVQGLIELTLSRGAPDNVSIIVVEAKP
jgi:serine/threonine protein phosphatase PrpC